MLKGLYWLSLCPFLQNSWLCLLNLNFNEGCISILMNNYNYTISLCALGGGMKWQLLTDPYRFKLKHINANTKRKTNIKSDKKCRCHHSTPSLHMSLSLHKQRSSIVKFTLRHGSFDHCIFCIYTIYITWYGAACFLCPLCKYFNTYFDIIASHIFLLFSCAVIECTSSYLSCFLKRVKTH